MSRLARPAVIVAVAVVAALVAGAAVALPTGGTIALSGLSLAVLDAKALAVTSVSVVTGGHPALLLVDGRKVASASTGTLSASLARLSDGRHTVTAEVDRGLIQGKASSSRTITVDTRPPALSVALPTSPVRVRDAVTVSGRTERGARVASRDGAVTATGDGFSIRYRTAPVGDVVTATDAAGNAVTRTVTVRTTYPSNVRGVHMTGRAWAYLPLREPVLALVRAHKINAIQLDIKDEDGIVNYVSSVPLARTVGANLDLYDPRKVTAQLHAMGVRVIGRIVAFNDPKLVGWAVAHGHRDWVIQDPRGGTYLYGYNKHGFGNFANSNVRAYNRDLAVEAVKAGFDDVVFDYVRRPDGPLATMRFPGLVGTPSAAIASFLGQVQPLVRAAGGSLGAAAFAQASTRPLSTAQDIPAMAKHLDVVIPMDYPSHWNDGEYGVPNVYAGARQIVQRSLVDWKKAVAGTGCVVVPWLQDENFRGAYSPAKVKEQIAGARDNGLPGWLMWSAVSRFTASAYTSDATPAR